MVKCAEHGSMAAIEGGGAKKDCTLTNRIHWSSLFGCVAMTPNHSLFSDTDNGQR